MLTFPLHLLSRELQCIVAGTKLYIATNRMSIIFYFQLPRINFHKRHLVEHSSPSHLDFHQCSLFHVITPVASILFHVRTPFLQLLLSPLYVFPFQVETPAISQPYPLNRLSHRFTSKHAKQTTSITTYRISPSSTTSRPSTHRILVRSPQISYFLRALLDASKILNHCFES